MAQNRFIEACQDREKPFLFVSYSHHDSEEVQLLLEELHRNHYRFWYDEGVKSGKEWADEVGWRIANCTQFLVVLSRHSAASERVIDEINFAKQQHREFCIIYLEALRLNYGLELQIGRKYAIEKFRYSENDFLERFFSALASELRDTDSGASTGNALSELTAHYDLLEQIGKGGFAEVFRAAAKRTGSPVAVKHAYIDSSDSGRLVKSVMEQERNVLLRLSGCQGVPMLVDWYQDSHSIYLVEQLVPGSPLDLDLQHRAFSSEDAVQLGLELLDMLEAFSNRQVLYLDLKPKNLLRDKDGRLWIVDYGSSRIPGGSVHSHITPGFSAPEQLHSEQSELRFCTDLYALGRTLLFLLLRSSFSEHAFREFSGQTHSLRYFCPEVSAELEYVLEIMTAEQPEDRFQSPEFARAALQACLNPAGVETGVLYWRSENKLRKYKEYLAKKGVAPHNSSPDAFGGMQTVMLGEFDYEMRNPNWDNTVPGSAGFDTM